MRRSLAGLVAFSVLLLIATVGAKVWTPTSALAILSTEFATDVNIISGPTASLTVTTENGASDDFVQYDADTLSISSKNEGDASGVAKIAPLSLALILLSSFMFLTFSGKFRYLGIICLLFFLYSNQAVRAGDEKYVITLTVPDSSTSDFVISNFLIQLGEGSVSASSFTVDMWQVEFSGSGSLALQDVDITGALSFTSQGSSNVVATRLITSSSTRINITTLGDVNLDFVSFFGTAELTHLSESQVTLTGSHCTTNHTDLLSKATCTPASLSKIILNVEGDINIDFGATCSNVQFTDPDPSDFIPESPEIPTSLPARTWLLDSTSKANLIYREQWGSGAGSANFTDAGKSTEQITVIQSSGTWHPNYWWVLFDEVLPPLFPSATYNVSFTLSGAAANVNNNITSLRIVFLKNLNNRAYNEIPQDFLTNSTFDSKRLVVSQELATSGLTLSSTSATTFQASLSVPASVFYASGIWKWNQANSWENPPSSNLNPNYISLGIRIAQTGGGSDKGGTFYIKNVALTQSTTTFPIPTKYFTMDSEIFKARKPALALDPNPRDNCPWKQSGVKYWTDPSTWPSGTVPISSSAVITIPENTKVVIGSCIYGNEDPADAQNGVPPFVYNKWVIPATSELIFADAMIHLHVKHIEVLGKLSIGSETCRVYSPISLTFHGNVTTSDDIAPGMGSKGIGVYGDGILDAHGRQYHPTWTHLAAPAVGGSDRVYLQDVVNWHVGQEVVITTSFFQDDWWDQNEVRTIKAIDAGNKLIQFTEPLSYYHYAGAEYQSEVGLLSRNVVFQGYIKDSTDNGKFNAFGGHIMITGNGIGRFSGTQAIRMGQTNRIARYPYHFHALGNKGASSYVKDCSCLNTHFRCVTLHGTNEVLVTRNVAFNVTGHCYYLEDGVEENNTFSYNLAAKIKWILLPASGGAQTGITIKSNQTLSQPADVAAAGFYVTNAWNRYIGNAASGGWSGFSFPNLFIPIGLYVDAPVDPSARPNLEFDGNTAHSAGYYWGDGSCMYTGGRLRQLTPDSLEYLSGRADRQTRWQKSNETRNPGSQYLWNTDQSPSAWMRFNNTKVWCCQAGIKHWGDRAELVNFEAHDITRSATVFGESWVGNAIINGKSSNPLTGISSSQGFQFYDTWVKTLLTNVNFRNYQGILPKPDQVYNDNFMLVSMTHSDKYKPQGISATRNITQTNVGRTQVIGHSIVDTGSSRYYNFVDFDGSATLSSWGPTIVGSHVDWWKTSTSCRKEWSVWVCPKTAGMEVGNLNVLIPGLIAPDSPEPPHGTSNHIGRSYLFGDGVTGNRSSDITTLAGITGVTGRGWYLYFYDPSAPTVGIIPKTWKIETYLIPTGTWILLAVNYPAGTTFNISTDYYWGNAPDTVLTSVNSVDAVKNGNGTVYHFSGSLLYIKLIRSPLIPQEYFERDGAKLYSIHNSYAYNIGATCSTSRTVSGADFCSSSETVPA